MLGRALGWSSGEACPLLTPLVGIWVLPTSRRIGPLPIASPVIGSFIFVSPVVGSFTVIAYSSAFSPVVEGLSLSV